MKKNTKIFSLTAVFSMLMLCACGTAAPDEQEASAPSPLPQVYINELMASNKASIQDEEGLFSDWLELYNAGDSAAELEGYTLSDGENSWTFPRLSLESGDYALIFCSKDGGSPLCANFSLSAAGEEISLLSPSGALVDSFSYSDAVEDRSFGRSEDGGTVSLSLPSPGYDNSDEGAGLFQSSLSPRSALIINEAMSYNEWFLPFEGEYYDLVELKNISDSPVQLSDYCLSDKLKEYDAYSLPDYSLAPGELYIVQCTDSEAGAPFALSSDGDQLFLSRKDGELCDYISLTGIPYGGSFGRMDGEAGFFYFSAASPGQQNEKGGRSIAEKPAAEDRDGIFNDVDRVTVSLSAPGEIYYTLDGSLPDKNSLPYTDPVTIEKSSVLRAVNFEEGKLASPSLDLSYIINEGHELPVVSLIADPDSLFGPQGIYSNPTADWEQSCSLALFEGDSSFELDGGVKMHGATSRTVTMKKSFKVNFRPRYEGVLNYDLFENGVSSFSSVLIRSAVEDSESTQIRDVLMHQLAGELCPELPRQDHKYCALYINGEYWGLYALREAHDTEHYANHYGYDEAQLEHWKGRWPADSRVQEIYDFIISNDMSLPENYAFAKEHVHIESLIAWNIIQSYSCNLDLNSPNMRFYYSAEDDQLRFALVDLDLSMFHVNAGLETSLWTCYKFSDLCRKLLENQEFCELFALRLSEALRGPLAEEKVIEDIDRLAASIRPEIPRDYARWQSNLDYWEYMIESHLKGFVPGRTQRLAESFEDHIEIDPLYYEELFSEFIS